MNNVVPGMCFIELHKNYRAIRSAPSSSLLDHSIILLVYAIIMLNIIMLVLCCAINMNIHSYSPCWSSQGGTDACVNVKVVSSIYELVRLLCIL